MVRCIYKRAATEFDRYDLHSLFALIILSQHLQRADATELSCAGIGIALIEPRFSPGFPGPAISRLAVVTAF